MTDPYRGQPRRPQPGRGGRRAQSAITEQMRAIVDQMQTAADMMEQASGDSRQVAENADKAWQSTQQIVQTLVAQMAHPGSGGGFGGPMPVLGSHSFVNYGYPGPGNPAFGGAPGHGDGGSFGSGQHGFGVHYGPAGGGLLSNLQAHAAQMVNARWGLASPGTGRGPNGGPGRVEYRPRGDGTYAVHVNGQEEGTISSQQFRIRQAVSQGGQGFAQGGVMGMLGKLPVVGTVLHAANDVYRVGQFVGDQRAANAQYQSIYGPGTSGWDQRVHNFGGRFRNFMSNLGSPLGLSSGGLADADYDRAFKGVSAMGFQGGDRNNMIGFATKNFNSMGMSVDESLQLIGINAKTAATNLSTLHESLNNVSKMAQEAGQNADVFRQKFIQGYGTAVGAGFGAGSAALATSNAAVTAGQGRMFASWDTSSMYGSMGRQQVLANVGGYQSVAQMSFAAQDNPMAVATPQQTLVNSQLAQAATPEATAYARQLIKAAGGAASVQGNQNRAEQIAQKVIERYPQGVNPNVIYNGLQAIGITGVDQSNTPALITYWVQWLASNGTNITTQVARAMQATDQANLTTGDNVKNVPTRRAGQDLVTHKDGSGAIHRQGKTTLYDPVIGAMEDAGIDRVQVQTKNGPQLVSLETASKHYRDQLVGGTAIIESGPSAGQSVGAIYGKEQSAKYKDTTSTKAQGAILPGKSYQKLVDAGVSEQQINMVAELYQKGGVTRDVAKQMINDPTKLAQVMGSGGGGHVTISLQPGMEKYFKVDTTGSIVNEGAVNGAPVAPSAGGASVKPPR